MSILTEEPLVCVPKVYDHKDTLLRNQRALINSPPVLVHDGPVLGLRIRETGSVTVAPLDAEATARVTDLVEYEIGMDLISNISSGKIGYGSTAVVHFRSETDNSRLFWNSEKIRALFTVARGDEHDWEYSEFVSGDVITLDEDEEEATYTIALDAHVFAPMIPPKGYGIYVRKGMRNVSNWPLLKDGDLVSVTGSVESDFQTEVHTIKGYPTIGFGVDLKIFDYANQQVRGDLSTESDYGNGNKNFALLRLEILSESNLGESNLIADQGLKFNMAGYSGWVDPRFMEVTLRGVDLDYYYATADDMEARIPGTSTKFKRQMMFSRPKYSRDAGRFEFYYKSTIVESERPVALLMIKALEIVPKGAGVALAKLPPEPKKILIPYSQEAFGIFIAKKLFERNVEV